MLNKKRFAIRIIFDSITDVLILGTSLSYGYLIDLISQKKTFNEIYMVVVFVCLFTFFAVFYAWYNNFAMSKFQINCSYCVKNYFVEKLFAMNYCDIVKNDSSN